MQSASMKTFCKTDFGVQLPEDVQNHIGKMLAEELYKEAAQYTNTTFLHHTLVNYAMDD